MDIFFADDCGLDAVRVECEGVLDNDWRKTEPLVADILCDKARVIGVHGHLLEIWVIPQVAECNPTGGFD